MGDVTDLTIKILQEIRDEIRGTNARLDQTNARLDQTREELVERIDQTNARIEQTREELVGRIDQTNARLDTQERLLVRLVEDSTAHAHALKRLIAIADVTSARIDNILTGPLGSTVHEHTARFDALEADVATLKRRTG